MLEKATVSTNAEMPPWLDSLQIYVWKQRLLAITLGIRMTA